MAQNPQLKVEKRTVTGKKVKKLRKDGLLPGNVYGKDLPSTTIQLPLKDFLAIYKEVGETGLIDLQFEGKSRPVLIKNIAKDYRNDIYLHADFFQVNLKEKIKAMIPVEIVGEPKAVADKVGMLMQALQEVEVEALPTDLPEKIEVNVESLAVIDDQITVGDLKTQAGVTILTDAGQLLAKITDFPKEEEPEPKPEAEGEEGAAEGEAKEGEEGKSEGEDKKEENPKEDKKEE